MRLTSAWNSCLVPDSFSAAYSAALIPSIDIALPSRSTASASVAPSVPEAPWLSSTSIINSEHRAGYSDGGMILKPGGNKVLCSHYYDFSSLESGCTGGVHRNHTGDTPFPAEQLQEMLETSMTYKQAYNEVLVDSAVYKSNLPDSVAAFYYGLLPDEGNSTWSRVQTTAMYVAFLDHYQLSESQVPLVEFALDNPDTHGLLTDVSAGARKFLKAHPYGYALKRWREEHPELSEHPE